MGIRKPVAHLDDRLFVPLHRTDRAHVSEVAQKNIIYVISFICVIFYKFLYCRTADEIHFAAKYV